MTTETSKRARAFWSRLNAWYGKRVADAYGEEIPADWARVIDRHDNPSVKRALDWIKQHSPLHPPTLPQFEAALRPRNVPRGTNEPETPYSESLRLINGMFFIWLRAEVSKRGSKDGMRTVGDAEMAERRAVCRELALQHDLLLADSDPEATQDHLASSFADAMARIAPRDPLPTDLHVTWTNGHGR